MRAHLSSTCVATFCLLTLIRGVRADDAQPPRKIALLVGINRYDHRGLAERPLEYAERDVNETGSALTDLGFTVHVLTGSAKDEARATKANFEQVLKSTLRDVQAHDLVLIGFSGYGVQLKVEQDEDAFLCPVDGHRDEPSSLVSLGELVQTLDKNGGINLLLIDACRNDPGRDPGRGIKGKSLLGFVPDNTAILFSCAAGQFSLETKQAGGVHSIFFHHVIEGLRGAARNADGEITWDRLTMHVRENVDKSAKKWFPERLNRDQQTVVQTPHELRNLAALPILGKIRSKESPKSKN